jgi:nucleoside 2-deoxyribosyltransferase
MSAVYLAAPLFTAAERAWNAELAALLRRGLPGIEVRVPQEFCAAHEGPPADFSAIHRACLDRLAGAQAVLAVLDGADPDSGTCFEIGWACARAIPVIGLRTDLRPGEDGGANCMLTRSCRAVVRNPAAAVEAVAAALRT